MEEQTEYQAVLGNQLTRKEVLEQIGADVVVSMNFQKLSEELKEEFISFCMGNRGLKITYDPFFKFIFNPALYPERLSELLSLLLGEEVEVVEVLPNESDRINEDGSLLIMDILVRLRTGAYANVEIQKIGYAFPGQRCACYSSDLLMRQLARTKAKCKQENRKFSYKELKKVYTIVLVEESIAAFWKYPEVYIHRSEQTFDSGLELDLLQEYILIPLDVFREINHNNLSKIEAWLLFIGSDKPADIMRVIELYPEFVELYKELASLRQNLRELIGMYDYYRQLLAEADKGTVEYMIEEKMRENEELNQKYQEAERRISEQRECIKEAERELAEERGKCEAVERELAEQKNEIETLRETIARLNGLLVQYKNE